MPEEFTIDDFAPAQEEFSVEDFSPKESAAPTMPEEWLRPPQLAPMPPRPEFKDLSAGAPVSLVQPQMPIPPEQLTTFGGPRKPLASAAETLAEPIEEITTPRIQLPRLETKADDSVLTTVGKEALNIAAGLPEFASSNLGLLSAVGAAVAPTATSGAFTVQLAKDLGNQVLSTYRNWGEMDKTQKAVALTDIAGTGVMAALTGRAAAKGLREIAEPKPATETPTPEIKPPPVEPEKAPAPQAPEGETVPTAPTADISQATPEPEKVQVSEGGVNAQGKEGVTPNPTESAPEPAKGGAKEPWEMNKSEYRDYFAKQARLGFTDAHVDRARRLEIEAAIKSGDPVPAKVLADYPDLKPTVTGKGGEPSSNYSIGSLALSKSDYDRISFDFMEALERRFGDLRELPKSPEALDEFLDAAIEFAAQKGFRKRWKNAQDIDVRKLAGSLTKNDFEQLQTRLLKTPFEFKIKPTEQLTPPPAQAGGEMQATVIPGGKEFVEQDLVPGLQNAAKALKETAQQVQAGLAAPTRSSEAALGAGIIREHRAKLAQEDLQVREKFARAKSAMDSLSKPASLDFIDRIERGTPQPTPEAQALAAQLRREFDRRVADVRALGTGKLQHIIQDYFPHIWKDPTAAASWYARILGRRPLKGPASFLKQRTIPLTADGVAAGLEPVSYNPIELSLLKLHEMDRYVMGQKIFQEFKDKGLAKFSRSDIPPKGYAKIDDRVANVVEYRPTTTASGAPGAPERILRGHWYVQEDAARVLNNFLSPGLEKFAWYRALRWFGNTLNMAQLGLSGYHMMFTMIDSGTSKLSLGIEQLAQGKPKGAITSARGLGGTVLANQLEAYYKGSKVLQEYTKPGSVGGEYAKVVDALLASGGRTEMPKVFKNDTLQNFFTALRSGNYPGAVLRAPFAAIEAVSYPLMQNIVPRLKLGVFNDMALHEIERLGPTVSRDQFRQAMGKIWDSVDNRMGELVYDNLFWHRTLKDLSFLAVRAVGWNLGTIRELGGGMVDSATVMKRLRSGDPVVTKRMAYLVALPMTVGLMGALYQKLHTGKGPQDLRDYYYPKTGKTLPDGTEERVDFPSYLKDMESYRTQPVRTMINKLHPTWGLLASMYENKDYYGTQTRNPDDPLVKQVGEELKFVASQYVPFSARGAERRVGGTEDKETAAESFFGVMPIPAHIARTPAQNKIMEYGLKKMPAGARTPEEAQRQELKKDLEKQIQAPDDYAKARTELLKMQREGKLTRGQMLYEQRKLAFERQAQAHGLSKAESQWLFRFKHLNLEEAEHVFEIATPREKAVFNREMLLKRRKQRVETQAEE